MRRLVEAELLFDPLDEFGIQPLGAAIARAGALGRLGKGTSARTGLAAVPVTWAITCSTGPPGANCTMTKLITMMPSRVGTISSRRRKM